MLIRFTLFIPCLVLLLQVRYRSRDGVCFITFYFLLRARLRLRVRGFVYYHLIIPLSILTLVDPSLDPRVDLPFTQTFVFKQKKYFTFFHVAQEIADV